MDLNCKPAHFYYSIYITDDCTRSITPVSLYCITSLKLTRGTLITPNLYNIYGGAVVWKLIVFYNHINIRLWCFELIKRIGQKKTVNLNTIDHLTVLITRGSEFAGTVGSDSITLVCVCVALFAGVTLELQTRSPVAGEKKSMSALKRRALQIGGLFVAVQKRPGREVATLGTEQ